MSYEELGSVLRGPDRRVEVLAMACAEKARLMYDQGDLPSGVSAECILSGCATRHVARIHRSRGDLSRVEYEAVSEGVSVTCFRDDCPAQPDFDTINRPHATMESVRESNYVPSATAAG